MECQIFVSRGRCYKGNSIKEKVSVIRAVGKLRFSQGEDECVIRMIESRGVLRDGVFHRSDCV